MTYPSSPSLPSNNELSRGRLSAILAVFTVVLTLGGTDMTKVAVALPELTERLSLSALQDLWVADVYALTTGVAMIPSAVLADRYGRKRAYITGLTVAMVGAVVAGTALGPVMMILGRIGQGIGTALLIAATVAIIRVSFPTIRSRGFAYGLWVAGFSAGIGLGPLLGGVVLGHLSWNWVFWINVPVLGLCLLAAVILVPESKNTYPPGVDVISIVTSTAAVAGLTIGLKTLTQHNPVVPVTVLLGVAVLALSAFCFRQVRLQRPYLDIALLKDPVVSVCALSIAATTGLFNGTLYLLIRQLQDVEGHSATSTGVTLLPLAAASVAGGVFSPSLRRWISTPHLMAVGFSFASLGSLLLVSMLQIAHPAGLVLLGLGASTVMAIASNDLMSAAPPSRTADAGAIQESAFALGAGTGIASLGVLAVHYGGPLSNGTHTALGISAFVYTFFGIAAALILLAHKRCP